MAKKQNGVTEERMKKTLNDLKLKFEAGLWALDPELALIDTILEEHPELYEIVKGDIAGIGKDSTPGRQDSPTVEQVVRAALYKEMKQLNYRELEYAQYDSRICSIFIKLDGRKPLSFTVLHKYISQVTAGSLKRLMVGINRIMIQEAAVEDGKRVRIDSTVVETNIHYPTNNELAWDCIKTAHRMIKQLEKSGCIDKVRNYQKQAKKHRFQINNTKKSDKRKELFEKELFEKQLKLLRSSINQADRAVVEANMKGDINDRLIAEQMKCLLPKMEKVYDITRRHELLGESVPNADKIFSIYEEHTDIIVKGKREAEFGHKVNLTTGRSNIILDVEVVKGNPADRQLYAGVLERLEHSYGITSRNVITDGGYASLKNQETARSKGVINII